MMIKKGILALMMSLVFGCMQSMYAADGIVILSEADYVGECPANLEEDVCNLIAQGFTVQGDTPAFDAQIQLIAFACAYPQVTRDFMFTWTILAAICSKIEDIDVQVNIQLQDEFQATWTAIAQSTEILCSKIEMLQDRIDNEFSQTWTILNGMQLRIDNEFAQTWTAIQQSTDITCTKIMNLQNRIDNEFAQTWTTLNGLQLRIDNEFAQTWTILQDIDNEVDDLYACAGIPIDLNGVRNNPGMFVINKPGKYYVIEDLSGQTLTITSSNVHLDLKTRRVKNILIDDGVVGTGSQNVTVTNGVISGPADNGVYVEPAANGITLTDLVVKNATGNGVLFDATTAFPARNVNIENVSVIGSGSNGISLNNVIGGLIKDSTLRTNGGAGVFINDSSCLELVENVISCNTGKAVSIDNDAATMCICMINNVFLCNTGGDNPLFGVTNAAARFISIKDAGQAIKDLLDCVGIPLGLSDVAANTLNITASGKYFLTDDLAGVDINISASNVYLDLKQRSVRTVSLVGALTNVTVTNGIVNAAGATDDGIDVVSGSSFITLSNLAVKNAQENGIRIGTGAGSSNNVLVENVELSGNAFSGILFDEVVCSVINNCRFYGNTTSAPTAAGEAGVLLDDCMRVKVTNSYFCSNLNYGLDMTGTTTQSYIGFNTFEQNVNGNVRNNASASNALLGNYAFHASHDPATPFFNYFGTVALPTSLYKELKLSVGYDTTEPNSYWDNISARP